MRRRACLAITVLAAAAGQVYAQDPVSRSTVDGVFTAAQAQRGESAFFTECIDCHELAEFKGPDAVFVRDRGKSIWPIFDFIWSEMPEDRPAWLEPAEYVDILAFLLSWLGMPAGAAELRPDPDTLRSIRLEYPDGD